MKYNKDMGKILIESAKNGEFQVDFCARVNITGKTFNNWLKKYKAFNQSNELAKVYRESFYTKRLRALTSGQKVQNFDKRFCKIRSLEFIFKTVFKENWSVDEKNKVDPFIQNIINHDIEKKIKPESLIEYSETLNKKLNDVS